MALPYRPYKPVMSYKEVLECCRQADGKSTHDDLISYLRPPFSSFFAGQKYLFRFSNGETAAVEFHSDHSLTCTQNGKASTEYYEALESTRKNVYLVHFYFHEELPCEGATVIIDTDTKLVTWVRLLFGTDVADNCVESIFLFGSYGDELKKLHHYTDEMAGVLLDWQYSDEFSIRHEYVTPYNMLSPGDATADEEEMLFRKTLPTKYVKIRDNLFLVSFIEDGGSEAALLIDMDCLRDVGAFYGIGEGKLSSFTIGAKATRYEFGLRL